MEKNRRVSPRRLLVLFGLAAGIVWLALVAVGRFLTGPAVDVRPGSIAVPEVSEERLRETVRFLSEENGPRSYRDHQGLERAAAWIEARFREAGLAVEIQEFTVREGTYRNVLARRQGSDPDAGLVVVGAHYDAYGAMPGADDNASGVAVLLEVARSLPASPPRQTQVFAAFAVEEPPFFASDDMGSARYAQRLVDEGAKVDLMIALDLVGYFTDEPGSQQFPVKGMGLLYPDRGNFIAVVGDLASGRSIGRVKRGMQAAGTVPVHSFRGPAFIPGVMFSDHLSFRRRDLPGVLITDTAFLRNPHYHSAGDTIDTLDFRRMAAVARALLAVLLDDPGGAS